MFHRTRWHVPAIVAGTIGATGAVALAADPAAQDLTRQIADLQKQVDALKATQAQAAATTAADRATIDSVLRDAEARSTPSLQASSTDFTAGYKGGKFIIQSADGKFSINPNFQLQARSVTNFRDTGGDDDWVTESGFELRRAKFGFAGNVYTPDLTYEFLWETARNTGAVSMQDAWLRYRFSPEFLFRFGQFKNPLGKEQTGSSKRLLAAERSLLNELLINGDDYVQGVTLIYAPAEGPLRAEVGYTDGTLQSNTDFRDTNAAGATADTRPDFGFAGRAEYQLIGERFKGYDDYTAMGQASDLLVLGAGADITQTGDSNLITYTADVQYENTAGLGLFGAFIGRYADSFNADGDNASDIGFLVQAAQMLNVSRFGAEWEIFGRYDVTFLDDERVSDPFEEDVHEITVGTNAYFKGHAAKMTIDFSYLPNGVPSTVNSAGYISSAEDQFVIRGQFQLLI